jgi:[acyl-carrier-protein] S-malonyltransferase
MTTAWVFPGQGSQVVGMGRDVYEQSPSAHAIFQQADEVLGLDLSQLCFEGPTDQLTQTENAQPALLTTSLALMAAARELSNDQLAPPAYVAGHSLGEWTALVGAGSLQFDDAVQLVRRRGELMAAATEGTMAAVIGLQLEALRDVCAEASEAGTVVIANENAPGQLVISGTIAGIERAGVLAKQRGAKRVLPLNVSAAFHSPLMQAAAHDLEQAIATVESVKSPHPPVISNVIARPLTEPNAIRQELVEQVTAPVRWIASIEYMRAEGVTRFVEIGPGNVLTGLIKRIAPEAELVNVRDITSLEQWLAGN